MASVNIIPSLYVKPDDTPLLSVNVISEYSKLSKGFSSEELENNPFSVAAYTPITDSNTTMNTIMIFLYPLITFFKFFISKSPSLSNEKDSKNSF